MFDHIVTLALNPSLDTTIWIESLHIGASNTATEEHCDAGGKTVNVSRVLTDYGVANKLLVLLGKGNQTKFVCQLDEENVDYLVIPVEGYTRENLSLVDDEGHVTRIMRKGFTVSYEDFSLAMEALSRLVTPGTLVMISGSLPPGISTKMLRTMCESIKGMGGAVGLDCASVTKEDVLAIKPWIMKPNQEEFQALVDNPSQDRQVIAQEAKEFVAQGIEHCLVSLGGGGLLYVSPSRVLSVQVPVVDVKSTVGAGDSMLAGFVRACQQGMDVQRAAAMAAAFGTAACMLDGTNPPHKITVGNILQQVRVEEL